MLRNPKILRKLGTMVAYGFPRGDVGIDLDLAVRLGAEVLEILPDWRQEPDPLSLRNRVADCGLTIHSAHGCWGGRAIRAERVDLGNLDADIRQSSLDDLRTCVDWIATAGGQYLVIHPGGLSAPEQETSRREALSDGLIALADHARGSGVVVCVENMPPGVYPGSRTVDLAKLIHELDRDELALTLDTGHANITSDAAAETLAAGARLRTTHVHDNNGRQDTHEPPGLGTVDWDAWIEALDTVEYDGPIMLECIRHLRQNPQSLNTPLRDLLSRLTTGS